MGRRKRLVLIGRVEADQAERIKRLAELHDRPAAWIQRRAIAIGLQHFTMPTGATGSADSATVSERGHRAAQDEVAE